MEALIVFFSANNQAGRARALQTKHRRSTQEWKHVFPFTNRQKCHQISEKLTRGSVWRRELLNSPSGWQTAQRMALSSPVTPVDLPSRRSFRGSGRKGHHLPFQAQRFSENSPASCSFQRLQPTDGALCLSSSFVHVKWDPLTERW